MTEQSQKTTVALEYYRALRAETVERLKMRDAVLVAYMGATGALIGYSQQRTSLRDALDVLIPFLALGAATMIAQHQDQIVAFNQYISLELTKDLPDPTTPVIDFSASRAGVTHLAHNLWMNLAAQLILICGPPAFLLWDSAPYVSAGWSRKETYGTIGLVLTLLTAARIVISRNFRHRVMSKLAARQDPQRKATANSHKH